MRKLFVWASVLSGIAAAYLMYKRGAPIATIAGQALTNPVGTLVREVQNTL